MMRRTKRKITRNNKNFNKNSKINKGSKKIVMMNNWRSKTILPKEIIRKCQTKIKRASKSKIKTRKALKSKEKMDKEKQWKRNRRIQKKVLYNGEAMKNKSRLMMRMINKMSRRKVLPRCARLRRSKKK